MNSPITLKGLMNGALAEFRPGAHGWALVVTLEDHVFLEQPQPFQAEVRDGSDLRRLRVAYNRVALDGPRVLASAELRAAPGAVLRVEDAWSVMDGALGLERVVRVSGDAAGGFLSAITLRPAAHYGWPDVDAFAPGMIYGFNDGIARHAIGSVTHYLEGVRRVRVREDRLPAPLFGLAFRDGRSVAVADPAPQGDTTRADALDLEGNCLVDRRFQFAALGADETDDNLELGMWFPGTEGEVTYLADTPYANGQFGNNVRRRWRERYHPLQDGFEHRYQAAFRFASGERDQDFRRGAWRWAWGLLKPKVEYQDLPTARRVLAGVLEDAVRQVEDRAGPAHVMNAVSGVERTGLPVVMGFTGRAVETGELLLAESVGLDGPDGARRRGRALAILETFARLPASPPQAEGVRLADGRLMSGARPDFYLRALAEGGKFMLRAYARELADGREQPGWLRWCRDLADWLLTQEHEGGGFPRSWEDITSKVVLSDARSSTAVAPFFAALSAQVADPKYLDAAVRAAELCWALDGNRGVFVGGTLDNANVVDKEAGTLALEAYLALLDATGDPRWLRRACAAADFSETWIYLWAIPMAVDENPDALHWKPGVSTVGAQLIATGHSLTDAYMAWGVADYARLFKLTGDAHYLDVARLLLHNTKTMLAMPGRSFDLAGPGWQQEHWSFAPPRGYGQHREWLPWVATSQLEGIRALEELDAALAAELASRAPEGRPS